MMEVDGNIGSSVNSSETEGPAADSSSELLESLKYLYMNPSELIQIYGPVLSDAKKMTLEKLTIAGLKVKEQIRSLNNFELEDWLTVQGMFYATLILIIVTSIIVISANIYRKIRYAIPATVNCWFCNTNTKVLYSLRDTWTCPTCHQYNGFSSDGSYNKRIPAQFIEALNRPIRGRPPTGYQMPNTNGLCSQCNLNQVLKVFQLASFVPVNERNYDAEIEAEQKRLEQLYDICHQCKLVVEETLKRTPESKQFPTKRKAKVNKVIPNSSPVMTTSGGNSNQGMSSMTHSALKNVGGFGNDSGASENESGESFLSLDNLNISSNSRLTNDSFVEFHMPVCSSKNHSPISQPLSPACSLSFTKNTGHLNQGYRNEMGPLWKDYPMVQTGVSGTCSVFDSMRCPVGRPGYPVSYCPSVASPGLSSVQFSYQSSNMGSVFGGQKPLISPPKFSNSNPHSFAPHIRFGAYYGVSSSPPNSFLNTPMPVMFSPHYFTNPISRSSSQSSGFVSQQGGIATSLPQPSTSNGYYMTT